MRLKLTLAYVGSGYAGWQRQAGEPTVQEALEEALASIEGRPTTVFGAGRTDAGVHAAGQVAHVDVSADLGPSEWTRALNAHLPTDVRVLSTRAVASDFHARYGARRKVYRYFIDESSVASPFLAPFAWHRPGRLDLAAMQAAAEGLRGEIDQRTFASRPEGVDRPRPLEEVSVERGRLLTITVVGRSFLRYVVRGIVGTLEEVGRGRRAPEEVAALARSGRRRDAGPTAPPHGLLLAAIAYVGEKEGTAAAGPGSGSRD